MANGKTWETEITDIPRKKTLNNTWELKFDPEYGYGKSLETDTLFDWTTSDIFDVKHYSGTVDYSTSFDFGGEFIAGDKRLILDLGTVNIAAKVFLNDKEIATLWMPPFTVDITEYAKKGTNQLKIEVTNTWTNRLIGDEQYPRTDDYELRTANGDMAEMPEWYTENEPMPMGKRSTFSAFPFYKKTDALMPSGLMGPVQIRGVKSIKIAE